MNQIDVSMKVLEGLVKDPVSGDYRVLPGYTQQLLRYGMLESWMDEEDDYWISSAAVEREMQAEQEREREQQ